MRQWCNDADLPECSSHGLRKASATILAEAGATEHQLMAIFGWSDSKMAQHYTKAAQSKRIIDAGFERRKTYVARKMSHFHRAGIPVKQIEEKTMEKQRPKTEMVGPEGTSPFAQCQGN